MAQGCSSYPGPRDTWTIIIFMVRDLKNPRSPIQPIMLYSFMPVTCHKYTFTAKYMGMVELPLVNLKVYVVMRTSRSI